METFQKMLSDVGIIDEADVENAMAYCAFVTEEYADLAHRLPNEALAKATTIGCIEFFIHTYEQQFTEMHNPVAPGQDDDETFTQTLGKNGIDNVADISVAKSFLQDFIEVVLTNSAAMLGQDRKAVAVVLATLRKLLAVIKEQH